MNFNKSIGRYLLMLTSILFLASCTSPSKGRNEIDAQEISDKMFNAGGLEEKQSLCDDFYSRIKDTNNWEAKLRLSSWYYILSVGYTNDVEDYKAKFFLYFEKYNPIYQSGAGEAMKQTDPIFFSNMQRCEELIIRAYEDSPSMTMKWVESLGEKDPFQSIAQMVLRNN